jgi:hypothetical protein
MLRPASLSQLRISETSQCDSALTLWNQSYTALRTDTVSIRNPETKTVIPAREISTSMQHEDESQRNVNNPYDDKENINISRALPYLHHHFSIPSIFPISTNAVSSYPKNLAEEQGIRSYRSCFLHPCYEYRIGVQSLSNSTLQYQQSYHDLQNRKDASSVCPLSSDCTLIFINGAEESKQKTTKHTKVSEKRPKSARKCRPKDRPKRPLSAYNLYFQEERQKILSKIPDTKVSSGSFQRKRRAKAKIPHGKIGFECLAKEIGQRWQRLDADQINHFKELANKEMIRYKEAMSVYQLGSQAIV